MGLTSATATVKATITLTDDLGETLVFPLSFSVSGITKPLRFSGTSDNSGWDVLYEAAETTRPEGDDDTGDAPFLFAIEVGDEDAILKITDDQGEVWYETVKQDQGRMKSYGVEGSTDTAVIAKIEIQSDSATDTIYNVFLGRD